MLCVTLVIEFYAPPVILFLYVWMIWGCKNTESSWNGSLSNYAWRILVCRWKLIKAKRKRVNWIFLQCNGQTMMFFKNILFSLSTLIYKFLINWLTLFLKLSIPLLIRNLNTSRSSIYFTLYHSDHCRLENLLECFFPLHYHLVILSPRLWAYSSQCYWIAEEFRELVRLHTL